MFDVMWSIELESEVESWIDDLDPRQYAVVLPHLERLETVGNLLGSRRHDRLGTDCSSFDSISTALPGD